MYEVSKRKGMGPDGTHQCPLSFHEISRLDHAYVSAELWHNLTFFSGHGDQDRLAISVTLTPNTVLCPSHNSGVSYTFWVTHPSKTPMVPSFGISVPFSLKACMVSNVGEEKLQCTVTTTNPLPLEVVFISTHDLTVYHLVREHSAFISRLLCEDKRIIRAGGQICFDEHSELSNITKQIPLVLAVTMTEPVLQGFVEKDRTRFLITLDGTLSDDVSSREVDKLHSIGSSAFPHMDDFTIDEHFLASSTLSALASPQAQQAAMAHNTQERSDITNGPGSSPWTISNLSLKMIPHAIDEKYDECYTGFVHADLLGKIGLFEGDWAIVKHDGISRLAQVRSSEQLPSNDCLYTSPVFIRNCGFKHDRVVLLVQIIPIGTSPLCLPTATSVTISRVASPSTSDRTSQNLQFNAVKHFFRRHKRLIKKGDLIAIPLCQELRDLSRSADGDEETFVSIEDLFSGVANVDYRPNAVAFFVVTELDNDASAIRKADCNKGTTATCYSVGDFGCWLDSSSTKVLQSGVEHSDVPYLDAYIGLPSMRIPVQEESIDSAAYRRLDEVLKASAVGRVDLGSPYATLLIGSSELNMRTAVYRFGGYLGFHIIEISSYDLIDETESKTANRMKEYLNSACTASPCILLVENVDALLQTTQPLEPGKEFTAARTFKKCLYDLYDDCKEGRHTVIVVATTDSVDRLPPVLSTCFKEQIVFEVPDENERLALLISLTADDLLGPDVSLRAVAMQTAALGVADLLDLVQRARHRAVSRIYRGHELRFSPQDVIRAGVVITGMDFETALTDSRSSYSQSIGAPSIPSVAWEDVGGLASVKEDILDTIQLPLDHPELFSEGLKQRSGILLYGPPGTGKTMLAKAVATSCSLNFLSVKGPEMLNMYIGESEANVRRIFQRARDAKPCVIFFDELDSIAPKRGNHGDSGGVMDRIVSQLLAELDGMSTLGQGAEVFVIGATNRPDLLDPALLRPGRFDRMLYLGISETHDAQLNILEALTRKFRLHPDLQLPSIAELCPFNYTGADFYALCSDAMLKAMSRKAEEVQHKIDFMNLEPPQPSHQYPITPQYYLSEMAAPSDTDVLVTREDFLQALEDLIPSVSMAELAHYKEVQERFTQK